MILVGGQNSTVYTIDSTGASTLIADLSGVTSELEGSEVAPLSSGHQATTMHHLASATRALGRSRWARAIALTSGVV